MAPASFGDREYWDARYIERRDDFEWLLPATALDSAIGAAVESAKEKVQSPRLIHLGCGTSSLSYHLREFVGRPGLVNNVDFSGPAIEMCRERERELFGGCSKGENGENGDKFEGMEWTVVDLLSATDVTRLAPEGTPPYDVIVDKSTCDSVCCADDVSMPPSSLLRAVDVTPADPEVVACPLVEGIHPLDMLGITVAYLAPPGTHWVALSYSNARFENWFPEHGPPPPAWIRGEKNCLPDPGRLWELKSWEAIPAEQREGKAELGVHTPQILHYVYVLVRTDVRLAGGVL